MIRLLLFATSALVLLLLTADHAHAQTRDSDLNLPEWAAPREPEAYESFSSESNAESTRLLRPMLPKQYPSMVD